MPYYICYDCHYKFYGSREERRPTHCPACHSSRLMTLKEFRAAYAAI